MIDPDYWSVKVLERQQFSSGLEFKVVLSKFGTERKDERVTELHINETSAWQRLIQYT